jgi:nucleotide-binding universal stress UspA family protein
MPIKTILAVLNSEAQAANLSKSALAVAKRFEAHLIGLHVVPNAFVYSTVPMEATGELIEAQRQASEATAGRIEMSFKAQAEGSGVPFEWRKAVAQFDIPANVAMRFGRIADLVIVSQPETAVNMIDGMAMTEEILLGLGRPVLVVPNGPALASIGKRILLAWNGSKESARATFDALPFLQAADSVRILSAQPPKRRWSGAQEAIAPATGLATVLERHGVRCALAQATAAAPEVGNELLAQAKANDCDLIVMGGYGHWRINEIVFGGATRAVLDQAGLPVLMSH